MFSDSEPLVTICSFGVSIVSLQATYHLLRSHCRGTVSLIDPAGMGKISQRERPRSAFIHLTPRGGQSVQVTALCPLGGVATGWSCLVGVSRALWVVAAFVMASPGQSTDRTSLTVPFILHASPARQTS